MSSHDILRDLALSSTSKYEAINSNQKLLNYATYQNNETETRKILADLQIQINSLKNNVEKKDKLIFDLSTGHKVKNNYEIEVARFDNLLRHNVEKKDKVFVDISSYGYKDNKNYGIEAVRFDDYLYRERAATSAENVKKEAISTYNAKMALTGLQHDNKEYQSKIFELESRIRTHMHDREDTARKTDAIEKKLNNLVTQLETIVGMKLSNTSGVDTLVKKISEIVNENLMLKGKYMTQVEKLDQTKSETKTKDETMKRLVDTINKFEKDSISTTLLINQFKVERDDAVGAKSLLEKEIVTLIERCQNIQTAWQASKTELESKMKSNSSTDAKNKQLEYDALYAKNSFMNFKEEIAKLLCDGKVKVEAKESDIIEKIKNLMLSTKERGLLISTLDNKLLSLTTQIKELEANT